MFEPLSQPVEYANIAGTSFFDIVDISERAENPQRLFSRGRESAAATGNFVNFAGETDNAMVTVNFVTFVSAARRFGRKSPKRMGAVNFVNFAAFSRAFPTRSG